MKKKKISERLKIGSLITALFIVSSSIGYGIEITEDFINGNIVKDGLNIEGEKISIINNGVIAAQYDDYNDAGGNGITIREERMSSDEPGSLLKVVNNGMIKGEYESDISNPFTANGINIQLDTKEVSLEKIENNGIIMGKNSDILNYGANGIYINSFEKVVVENISNNGIISGESSKFNHWVKVGNGIDITGDILVVENNGVIKGINNTLTLEDVSGSSIASNTGNGVAVNGELKKVNNSGIFSGSISNDWNNSGNGLKGRNIGAITNSGVIKGSHQAVKGAFTSLINGGILAGKTIVDSVANLTNHGIEITLNADNSGNITQITNGRSGIVDVGGVNKTVLNGTGIGTVARPDTVITVPTGGTTVDSYLLSESLINNGANLIINGAGINKGALVTKENSETTLSDSIVNGYKTALYLEDGSKVTATNTIFNGGGLKNDVAVIRGSEGNNDITLLGNSIINGSVDLGNGDDTLLLANTTQINGALNGGTGGEGEKGDVLGLGKNTTTKISTNLNVLHNISGFETINTNGDVTLFETITVTDAANISLESGNLTLRVDPTKTLDGKVIGHALYGNTGNLSSTGGNLVVGLNGLGVDTIVSMGGTTITPETNDSWWKDSDHIKTNSLVLDGKLSADGSDINITLKENIPLDPSIPVDPPVIDGVLYEKLNQVYKSIASSGEIGTLAKTTLLDDKTYNESLGGLLTALDQIYANNPYAYTLKSSRDSLKLFEDNMSYLTIKPKINEWIVQGKAIYTGIINDNEASGKNYYGFDTGHRNYKTTTNTIGGIATAEYGLTDKSSVGFVLGGNNQDIKFRGTSEINGTSMYLGSFAKTEINNFKFMTGLGYQYTSADVNRGVSNDYDSFKTDDRYNINSFNTFVEAKYSLRLEDNLTIEPKTRLSYYYVSQESVNEGHTPGELSIAVDRATSSTADAEVGVDFIKTVYIPSGKIKNILSIGVISTLGSKEKSLDGYVVGNGKNGSKFEIQGIELPQITGKIAYNIEVEQDKGMIYSAGINYEFAKDYNRNINVSVGVGYKF
jgi:hypothetical protein